MTNGGSSAGAARLSASRRREATRLMLDRELHSWLSRRQKGLPRAFMSAERRRAVRAAFESIDVDGSGSERAWVDTDLFVLLQALLFVLLQVLLFVLL